MSANYKLDKTKLAIVDLRNADDEKDYWLSQSPAERLAALEFMRKTMFNYDPSADRLQRVFEVAQR